MNNYAIQKTWFSVFALAIGFAACASAQAITIGQVDDFSDGVARWGEGEDIASPNPPGVLLGGPGGESDRYLDNVSAGGVGGPGSRLTMFETTFWAGDYTSAGVTGITLDLKNFGATALSIRLRVEGAGGSFRTNDVIELSAFGEWQTGSFSLAAEDLTGPGTDAALTLSGVSKLRVEHAPTADRANFQIPTIAARLGVDNITAVPEPSSFALAALTIATLLLGRGFRRR